MDSLEQAREALTERLEKLAVYMDNYQHKKWCGEKSVPVHNYSGEAVLIREAIAALSRPVEGVKGEPRVKPLEWGPYHNPVFAGPDIAIASFSAFGSQFYQVQRDPRGPGFIAFLAPQHGTSFWESKGYDTIEAAKEAAQADYGRRILSALTAPPVADSEALRERVAELERSRDHWMGEARRTLKAGQDALDRAETAKARLAQAEGGPAVTEVERGLRALLTGEFSSLTIGFNDHHACNYVDAKGWQEQFGGYGCGEDELIEWASEEERQKAIDENSVWTIQWYPNTPVGFNCVGASTLAAALEAALHPQSAAGEEGKP